MHARKHDRRVRALVHVRKRIELWTQMGQGDKFMYDGKRVDPNAKLNMALQEEADLATKGIR